MKKITLIILAVALGTTVFAQKIVPKLKVNSIINYIYSSDGQSLPMVLTFTSIGNPTKMDWSIDGYGSGSYEMSAKALESGKGMDFKAPEPDVLTKLPDYKTIACISKAAFTNLVKNQGFEYNDIKYAAVPADTANIKLNNQPLDVIHAVATNGKGEIWVLNNPDFPLICRTKNNADGTDLNLVSIQ
ncbi:hypothetical protein ACFGVR_10830 [Mucilaginibacter sp. AW1-3]